MTTQEMQMSNGAAAAAMIGAGIGTFAMGLLTTLSEAISAVGSALNWLNPVGALSGKSSIAFVAWLLGWAIFHNLWKGKQVDLGRIFNIALVLLVVGVLLTFPPFFELFIAE